MRRVDALMRTVLCAAALVLGAHAGAEEARNVRLVGFHDLAARSAYQPTIKRQGDRWIAYIGSHGGRSGKPLNGQLEESGTSLLDLTDPRAPELPFLIPRQPVPAGPRGGTGGGAMTPVFA